MQTEVATTTSAADTLLSVFSLLVIVFGALWLVTSIIGYFHRRAYNLTLAESGGSPIRPDFLKVDKKRRAEAIERGEEYSEVLEKRAEADTRAKAAAGAPPSSPVSRLSTLSRMGALVTGTVTLVAAIVNALTRVQFLQSDIQRLSGWDSFVETVKTYPVGATVAFLVIGANLIVFVQKTPAKS
jgi:uncharacterized membrane protein